MNARAFAAVASLACCTVESASSDTHDFELWHNVAFLQGHGPGYDALETPWRLRHGRLPGTTRTSTSARLPLYVADGDTISEVVHDHTWGSQYRPRSNVNRCTSADGPRCLSLAEEYESLLASGVRKTAGNRAGSLPAGKGHGSSAIVQIFREYRQVKGTLTASAKRQLPEDFRLLGLSSSDGAGSLYLSAAPATTQPPWVRKYGPPNGFARALGASPGPAGTDGQLRPLITPARPRAVAHPRPTPPPPRPPPPPPPPKKAPAPPPKKPQAAAKESDARYTWSSANTPARIALTRLNGHYSVLPPQNDWHKVSIHNGVWTNDEGVRWGIEALVPKSGPVRFVAAQDCIYWKQGQCTSKSWADNCELTVVKNGTHPVARIRWLGESYVREG